MEFKVTGWKFFKGAIDGKDIDSGRVYVEVSIDDRRGNGRGTTTAELRVPDAECIKRIAHLPLPALFDIAIEQMSDGKNGIKQVVMDVRPIQSAKVPQPVAKAA